MHWSTLRSLFPSPYSPTSRRQPFEPVSRSGDTEVPVLHSVDKKLRLKPREPSRKSYPQRRSAIKHWRREGVRYALVDAWTVLQQPSLRYDIRATSSTASTNTRAKKLGFDEVPLRHLANRPFFEPIFVGAYKERFCSRKPVLVEAIPQQPRIINSEGDVADVTLVDHLLSSAAILNQLLSASGRHDLRVVVQQHTADGDFVVGREIKELVQEANEEAGVNVVLRSAALDHALVLVGDKAFRQFSPSLVEEQAHLVLVEEKKSGYIKPDDWRVSRNGRPSGNLKVHAPQTLMYAYAFRCGRLILTDHVSAVAVRVDADALEPHSRRPVDFAWQTLAPAGSDPDGPSSNGPVTLRHSLCMLGVEALVAMGVLNKKLLPRPIDNISGDARRALEEGASCERLNSVLDAIYEEHLVEREGKPWTRIPRPKPYGYDLRHPGPFGGRES